MPTLLPKKVVNSTPIATDDEAHAKLVADPAVDTSTFADPHAPVAPVVTAPSSGFGSSTPSSFGSSGFGSSTPTSSGFGSMSSTQSGTTGIPQQNLTQAGSNAAQGAEVLVENNNSDWINKKWRPVMGWVYMLTCTMDFVIFPILWSLLQALSHGQVTSQWQPLTLQGAGLYHIAMGAVLGIAAYGRTKEKVAGAA